MPSSASGVPLIRWVYSRKLEMFVLKSLGTICLDLSDLETARLIGCKITQE